MAGTARISSSSTEVYRRNVARELVEAVAAIERDRDRLVMVVEDVLDGKEGAMLRAAALLDEIKGVEA